ncbi:MAG TPA: hypothetical protein VGO04_00510, partial [Ensifer sp.]|uniref:hypothetical protein n=1 Tax=Ensifer sp. TaxID=1872086 RepID=UPI002E12FC3C|nr:hypothetical protein [Ensifer sp.]
MTVVESFKSQCAKIPSRRNQWAGKSTLDREETGPNFAERQKRKNPGEPGFFKTKSKTWLGNLVPRRGLEPPHPFEYQHLKLARLPI